MRYLLEDRGDYFGILNEASDTYVAYVHPQKIDLRRGRYRIVDREGDEITAVVSIDDAPWCICRTRVGPSTALGAEEFDGVR